MRTAAWDVGTSPDLPSPRPAGCSYPRALHAGNRALHRMAHVVALLASLLIAVCYGKVHSFCPWLIISEREVPHLHLKYLPKA